ncbi:hypothetical protein [Rhodocyclus tenuis]|uniref:Uncharacterized protein n=1 Tax=Rhodocyclus tenuis TaxID=1066 RepID=A0A840GCZ0_RHOTE|nr:hypothetical protein [Rhodocyclus tenuis]MBB4248498.1 hypothetical protein [Rhodocyclus tenuis]
MSSPSTVTLVARSLGEQVGAVDGTINAYIGARDGNIGTWLSGTIKVSKGFHVDEVLNMENNAMNMSLVKGRCDGMDF